MIEREILQKAIQENVRQALEEDIGTGDITAQLIPLEQHATAHVITREDCILAGRDWANAVFEAVDPSLKVTWHASDGAQLRTNDRLFSISGCARSILTAERCALNFLQTLSATASLSAQYAALVAHTQVRILDTRKTLPGLRIAQKYAVSLSAAQNHRIGLYDAFLIKENHIMACGSIENAVSKAQEISPGRPIEVEVESLSELDQALKAGADIIMLDNFSLEQMKEAVKRSAGAAKLEASGNVTSTTLTPIAETGVDYISIGALTKDVKAIDLSMRFQA
jgi:nicotinate-nucleotide pyrophosphorylase (carboxylating)